MKKRIDLSDRLQAGLLDMGIDPSTATVKDIVEQSLSAEEGRKMVVKAITNLKWDSKWRTIRATVDFESAEGAPSRKQLTEQKLSEILRSIDSSLEELQKSFQEDKRYWDGGRIQGEVSPGPSRKERLLAAIKKLEEAGEGVGISRNKVARKFDGRWAADTIKVLVNNWKAWKEGYGPEE